ncbi:thiamine/thiamine pyrophosphate ABC transporter permease ThiP [Maritimibacter sp. UBA3975]|uniref:thiamine/thiamine pyrophosphate ABC transporter permease ThiP n=1 Tax=Maritimibacter sp. UBA3975 TaxID=1946833 RepID=UPI000C0AF2BD|nr:thiamine/thiamine pyrophosphate ABC transporter permease ThiP [Maritimibacter sp. UBA3975]MAM63305.1 thiamine/thiamine pyrophosphate ABC transporter permease ThiP [Maritimibacter sp.]|tara:strand:- start:39727 stop:41289 length:1563 start_codon:yes stop_codon:yes gene_type:complete
MARGVLAVTRTTGAGAAALALVLLLAFGTLIAVALRAEGAGAFGVADWAALRFTVVQATLSAALSVALAVPVGRALARRQFRGRAALVMLLGAPFILPVIVAVFGLISVFGRSGLVSQALLAFGFEPISIYGFHGVVLAHVFFNLPLATRLVLQGWLAIPAERFRLAASLGFTSHDIAQQLERPMLREVLPGAFLVIFLLCLTSFAVALALGGGPRATTIELAIYQAFRLDFDLGKAALLALVQFALGAAVALVALRVALPSGFGAGLDRAVTRWDANTPALRALDAMLITLATLFLVLPLAMIAVDGLPALATLPSSVFTATARSVGVALVSVLLTLALALPIAAWSVKAASKLIDGIGSLTIAASPLVIGTGLFIILFPVTDPFALALPVTALVNALMSLPFALRALVPALGQVEADYGRLAGSLGMTGMARLRLLWLPRLRRPLGFTMGLSAALSMGDLGVIALFASPDTPTLPLQIYRLLSAYRMDDAAGAALVLLAISLALFWAFDRGGRVNADA